MNIFYATHDGHAEKIAHVLALSLEAAGIPASPRNLANDYPTSDDICSPEACVIISSIRYGYHQPLARKLLKQMAPLTPNKPLILLSVNLTARKETKRSATGNTYLRKWIKATKAHPLHAEALAGKLDYPRYTFFDRNMIRFIMLLTGGPTDPTTVIDYTPWDHVKNLGRQIAVMVKPKT